MAPSTPQRRGNDAAGAATSSGAKGPMWEKYRRVLTGRELRRTVDGREQVGVVCHSLQTIATLPPLEHSKHDRYTVAWQHADGTWVYPDKWVSSETDTFRWDEIRGMLQDRFVDHPQLPIEIRYKALPLQENGWRALPPERQRELDAKAAAVKDKVEQAMRDAKRRAVAAARTAAAAATGGGASSSGRGGGRGAAGKEQVHTSQAVFLKGADPVDAFAGSDDEEGGAAARPPPAKKAKTAAGASGSGKGKGAAAAAAAAKAGPSAAAGAKAKTPAAKALPPAAVTGQQGAKLKSPAAKALPGAAAGTAAAAAGGSSLPAAAAAKRAAAAERRRAAAAGEAAAAQTPKAAAGSKRGAGASTGDEGAGPSSRGTTAAAAAAAAAKDKGREKAKGKGKEKGKAAAGRQPKLQPQGVYVGITGRVYPPALCYCPGDLVLSQYVGVDDDEDPDQEWEVEAILDQAFVGDHKLYLIKWKGFELDVGNKTRKGNWEPVQMLRPGLVAAWEAGNKYPSFASVRQAEADKAVGKARWVKDLPTPDEMEQLTDGSDSEAF